MPTAVQLFYIFPEIAHKDIAGMDLGLLTPLLVLFFNWVWGMMAAYAIKISPEAYPMRPDSFAYPVDLSSFYRLSKPEYMVNIKRFRFFISYEI